MSERWTVDRVMALAPDSASQVAGRKLANPTPWSDVGWEPPLLWGSCQGSGKTPYRVAIDTSGPSYRCSCPSRKFPCKHTLALLFLWAEDRIDTSGGMSQFAAEWAAKRAAAAERQAAKADAPEAPKQQTEAQREAAARRAAQRDERVRSGMAELDRWLADQVTAGVAAATKGGYEAAEQMAARMVDAQAPGVAARLRELAVVPASGRGWPDRLVAEMGLLHLLAGATARQDELEAGLRHTVRMRLGFTTPRDEVLATDPVTDRWAVVGMRDSDEEQVSLRRVWLRGVSSGAPALVMLFTPYGVPVDNSLLPGMVVEGDVHYYPGRPRLRAAMGRRGAEVSLEGWEPPTTTVLEAAAAWRDAVAADPWLTELPAVVAGVVVPPAPVAPAPRDAARSSTASGPAGAPWRLVDATGHALPLVGTPTDLWQLAALTGGAPHPVFGELSSEGLRPTSYVAQGRLVTL